LRALERTGEVRSAAKDAGIDHSTAYARRKTHGEFAQSWKEALSAHAERVKREEAEEIAAIRNGASLYYPSTMQSALPGSPPRPSGREERVGERQVKRVNAARWTKAAERRFFATLAETNNIQMAAEAAGFSTNAIYARRLRNAVFREQWAAVVETARARLGLSVFQWAQEAIENALAGVTDKGPQMTVGEALQVLKLGAQPDVPTGPGGQRRLNAGARANVKVATSEEVADALRKRLIAFSKRLDREKRGGDGES
jgi:hypothetical protein